MKLLGEGFIFPRIANEKAFLVKGHNWLYSHCGVVRWNASTLADLHERGNAGREEVQKGRETMVDGLAVLAKLSPDIQAGRREHGAESSASDRGTPGWSHPNLTVLAETREPATTLSL